MRRKPVISSIEVSVEKSVKESVESSVEQSFNIYRQMIESMGCVASFSKGVSMVRFLLNGGIWRENN